MRVHTNVRHSTVTITITQSCIISKLKRYIGQKSRFRTPHAFDAPFGVPVRILRYRLVRKKLECDGEKFQNIFTHFDTGDVTKRHASVTLVYMTESLDVTPKTTEQNLTVLIVNLKPK